LNYQLAPKSVIVRGEDAVVASEDKWALSIKHEIIGNEQRFAS
jgi:hypothetical protein